MTSGHLRNYTTLTDATAADWRAANKGRRLDHIWVNAALAPALSFAAVHDAARDWPEPSDHAPVRAVFEVP